ncbi:MAG: undecaprenyl-diphosphate phosphatase [Dethiobacteria bacterium]|jgi:undecaprenyl-diphosphatase
MNYLEAIFLGLLQGLTEFLPVSSSGHLVIAQNILGITQPGVTFEVMVHFGTLLSIVWVFWHDISKLLKGFFSDNKQKKLFLLLLAGTLPTALIGVGFSSFFKGIFENPLVVGFMLLITGILVWVIARVSLTVKTKNINTIGIGDAIIIGVCQGLAIIPGISRSGSTILGSLLRGLNQETALKYSFLLAIPAIGGAAFLELWECLQYGGTPENIQSYLLASVVAFLTGIFAIKTFINLLKKAKFHYIAYYCWAAGAFTILYTLFLLVL